MKWDERILRRLKLHDIHYFLVVVQAGSMAKAAPLLSVSQPVISKAIANIEHALGVRLLDRSPRGVEPTMYGRMLIASSHAMFDELQQGLKEIRHLCDPAAGELSIGSSDAAQLGLVPTVISQIRTRHPRIAVHVVPAETRADQRHYLRERRIEFSIGHISDASLTDDEFETEFLFDEQLLVVAGEHNAWRRRRHVALAELVDEPWVLPSDGSTGSHAVAEIFRRSGLQVPRATVVASSFQLSLSLLADGPFLSLLPASAMSLLADNSGLRLVDVSQQMQAGAFGIVKLKKRALSSLAKLFIDLIRAVQISNTNIGAAAHEP